MAKVSQSATAKHQLASNERIRGAQRSRLGVSSLNKAGGTSRLHREDLATPIASVPYVRQASSIALNAARVRSCAGASVGATVLLNVSHVSVTVFLHKGVRRRTGSTVTAPFADSFGRCLMFSQALVQFVFTNHFHVSVLRVER